MSEVGPEFVTPLATIRLIVKGMGIMHAGGDFGLPREVPVVASGPGQNLIPFPVGALLSPETSQSDLIRLLDDGVRRGLDFGKEGSFGVPAGCFNVGGFQCAGEEGGGDLV